MTPAEFLDQAKAQLGADGLKVTEMPLAGLPAVIGYQGKFRLRWFATKLHTFVAVVALDEVTTAEVERVTEATLDYAKAAKGRLRGFQTGVAVLPVLAGTSVAADAATSLRDRPAKKWAAFALPAAVNVSTGESFTYEGRITWGGVYAKYLRQRLAVVLPRT